MSEMSKYSRSEQIFYLSVIVFVPFAIAGALYFSLWVGVPAFIVGGLFWLGAFHTIADDRKKS